MSLFLCTDVTSVKLINFKCKEYILAGIGSHVNIFDKTTSKRLDRQHVLQGQKIYGFVPDSKVSKILVFGGKQFTVIVLEGGIEDNISIRVLFKSIHCNDWLHAAVWHPPVDVAVLTAHNTVQLWNTELQSQSDCHQSFHNSILYSGLLVALEDGTLVFAGTVFSQVIIHSMGNDEPMHKLVVHNGVIFSIACDIEKELIVTTSDDRSVRIWGPKNQVDISKYCLSYWKNINIVCNHRVYGHLARVMRCVITTEHVVSVGEDSAVCFWDFEANLSKKITNQNGCIWAVDGDHADLLTGSSDGRIILHPLTLTVKNNYCNKINIAAKKLVFTAKGNLVILSDDDNVNYYDYEENKEHFICTLKHDSTYKLLSISHCKQIIAVIDYGGNLSILIEDCKVNTVKVVINVKLDLKVLSMQFADNRHIVLCCENGRIHILAANGNNIINKDSFILPNCKERWLTSAVFGANIYIFGDRCGNIHFYKPKHLNPVKTVRKVHGPYGPTSISIRHDKIITTGRDGNIKYFSLAKLKHLHTVDLDFQWVEKFINNNLICGFKGRVFVVYDLKNYCTLLEVDCGGGHRSWDINRFLTKTDSNYHESIRLVYQKNSTIHEETFKLDDIVSRNVINGSHCKEINSLKIYNTKWDDFKVLISGGEDTTVRISSLNFVTGKINEEITYKHLSNVRCLKIHNIAENKLLLISAGGRAQICVKILTLSYYNNEFGVEIECVLDYLIKGTDKERKGDSNWTKYTIDIDPETRIMDVEVFDYKNDYLIIAGCSDSLIRKYKLHLTESDNKLKPEDSVKYHSTCILKTQKFKYKCRDLLATTSTVGEIVFWNVLEDKYLQEVNKIYPIFSMKANQNGINCISINTLDENRILLASGGDDNAIHLYILIEDFDTFKTTHKLIICNFHCSLISGLLIEDKYVISVSIDHRITLSSWEVNGPNLESRFVYQTYSDVADIQGVNIIDKSGESLTACVYGQGIEVVKIPLK